MVAWHGGVQFADILQSSLLQCMHALGVAQELDHLKDKIQY